MQAKSKGASPFTTGIIMSSSAFCVVLLSPVFGYYVSFQKKYMSYRRIEFIVNTTTSALEQ